MKALLKKKWLIFSHFLNIFCFVRYIAFDFHKECKNMRWDRLSILLDQVAEMQDELR